MDNWKSLPLSAQSKMISYVEIISEFYKEKLWNSNSLKTTNQDLVRAFKIGRFWWSEIFSNDKIKNHNPMAADNFYQHEEKNMIARYNIPWQAKMRKYEQIKSMSLTKTK